MAKIKIQNQTVPITPDTGTTNIYVDSADKKIKYKDDAGVVGVVATEGSVTTIAQGIVDIAIGGLTTKTYPSITSHTLNVSANRTVGAGDNHYSSNYAPTRKELFSFYMSCYTGANSTSATVHIDVSDNGTTGWTTIYSHGVGENAQLNKTAALVLYPGKYYRTWAGVGAYTASCSVVVDCISNV